MARGPSRGLESGIAWIAKAELCCVLFTEGAMKSASWVFLIFLLPVAAFAQNPEVKFIADTLVVQADGTYDADPDLATLTFQIFAQDKDLKQAYAKASLSAQHIVEIAQRVGLNKEDIRSGALTVNPIYEG